MLTFLLLLLDKVLDYVGTDFMLLLISTTH